ncbi:hypothetical protein ACRAWD_03840 [Caulobacter segnis]
MHLQLQRAELRGRLIQARRDDAERARAVRPRPWPGSENSYQLSVGKQAALNDRTFLDAQAGQTRPELRAKVAADPGLAGAADACGRHRQGPACGLVEQFPALRMLEASARALGRLCYYARLLVGPRKASRSRGRAAAGVRRPLACR